MTALPSSGVFAQVDPTHVAAVGPAAAILFARISWRCQSSGEWAASRDVLAAETGLTPDTLRSAITVLREQEWVSTRRASARDATTVWAPLFAGQAEMGESPRCVGEIPQVELGESPISSTETGNTSTPTPDGDSLFDPTPALRSVPTTSDLDAEFSRFWELYPRRTGKKAARTAYGRARRTASVQAIATGLRAQLPSLAERDPQYVPHPATWLNQGRWEDEVPNAPQRDAFAGGELPPPPRTDLYG